MTDWVLRAIAAVLVTYAVSRVLRRLPIAAAEPLRSLLVHLLSALLVCPAVYILRDSGLALILPLMAQLGWFVLDAARGRQVTARAR